MNAKIDRYITGNIQKIKSVLEKDIDNLMNNRYIFKNDSGFI